MTCPVIATFQLPSQKKGRWPFKREVPGEVVRFLGAGTKWENYDTREPVLQEEADFLYDVWQRWSYQQELREAALKSGVKDP